MDYFRRRKKLVLGVAAGAAGATAAYYWWKSYIGLQLEKQRSISAHLSQLITSASQQLPGNEHVLGDEATEKTLDESMDSHFNYIQDVSTPQELEQLLPTIQEVLYEMTDVVQIKDATSPDDPSQPLNSAEKLKLLAQLCFSRTVAACYLIPLMDLYVRVKLNIIGRHLFLQEKLSKLRQPSNPHDRLHLPPRLTAIAVETFLKCDHFVQTGCRWFIQKAMAAADKVLVGVSMEQLVGPVQLVRLLADMLDCVGRLVGPSENWVDVMVAPEGGQHHPNMQQAMTGSADNFRKVMASGQMVDELQAELRQVLANYRFNEALQESMTLCFQSASNQLHSSFLILATVAAHSTSRSALAGHASKPADLPHSPSQASDCGAPSTTSSDAHAVSAADSAAASSPTSQPTTWPTLRHEAEGEYTPVSPAAATSTQSQAGGDSADQAGVAGPQQPTPSASPRSRRSSAGGALELRPLARTLKLAQIACEPLFLETKVVTRKIAMLQRVMSLCACAFAAPPSRV